MEEWNGGMEWRNGMEEWNGGMEWRNGMEEWNELSKIRFHPDESLFELTLAHGNMGVGGRIRTVRLEPPSE
jgi:hypothetical protein